MAPAMAVSPELQTEKPLPEMVMKPDVPLPPMKSDVEAPMKDGAGTIPGMPLGGSVKAARRLRW